VLEKSPQLTVQNQHNIVQARLKVNKYGPVLLVATAPHVLACQEFFSYRKMFLMHIMGPDVVRYGKIKTQLHI